jgi:hypothetical protein
MAMRTLLVAVTGSFLLVSGSNLFAQATQPAKDKSTGTMDRMKNAMKDTDTAYGSIKELTAGQKVVIDVDNAPDKTFDLASKDVTVNLAKGLKVGDPVKVTEHDVAGKTKSVTITKHTDKSVTHGDKDAKKQ